MAQVTDRNIGANPTGFDMRTEINNIIAALESDNSGSSAPLNTVAYMKWLDTSNATYYYVKERNHDNTAWVTLFRYTVATKIMEAVSNGVVLSQTNITSEIHASSSKTTPVDADEIGLVDSAFSFSLKKLTWANLKNTIISSFGILINGLTSKTNPVGADEIVIGDSATSYYTKKVLLSSLIGNLFGRPMVLSTAVASTSGTSIDFTGIPSWAKKIIVMFDRFSTSGTSLKLIQLGSEIIQVTGYLGASTQLSFASLISNNFTNGFGINSNIAADVISGAIEINLVTGNTYVVKGCMALSNAPATITTSGDVTLSGILDRIRVTTVNGIDTFDAGQISIMYEG